MEQQGREFRDVNEQSIRAAEEKHLTWVSFQVIILPAWPPSPVLLTPILVHGPLYSWLGTS